MNDEWIGQTYGYQSTHFKVDYRRMKTDIDYRMEYLKTNLMAAMVELGEAANEVPWKPWAASTSAERQALYEAGRQRCVGELVDTLFFVANALTSLNVTDSELTWAYESKRKKNVARQESGTYDGITTGKCAMPGCGRALDEPDANGETDVITNTNGSYCSVTHAIDHRVQKMATANVANEERTTR